MSYTFSDRKDELARQLNYGKYLLNSSVSPHYEGYLTLVRHLRLQGEMADQSKRDILYYSAMALDGDNKPSMLKDHTVTVEDMEDSSKRVKMSWTKFLLKIKRLMEPTEVYWKNLDNDWLSTIGSILADVNAKKALHFERVHEGIVDWYEQEINGITSCMSGKSYVQWYDENACCSLLLVKRDGELVGRALVWDTDQGVTCVDRIYPNESAIISGVKHWAEQNGFKTREVNSYQDHGKYDKSYTVTMRVPKSGSMPFMDTFIWGWIGGDGDSYILGTEKQGHESPADCRYEKGLYSKGMNTQGQNPIHDFYVGGYQYDENGDDYEDEEDEDEELVMCHLSEEYHHQEDCVMVHTSRYHREWVYEGHANRQCFEWAGDYYLNSLGVWAVDIEDTIPEWAAIGDAWDCETIEDGEEVRRINTGVWGDTRHETTSLVMVLDSQLCLVNVVLMEVEALIGNREEENDDPLPDNLIIIDTQVGYMTLEAYKISNPRPLMWVDDDAEHRFVKTLDLEVPAEERVSMLASIGSVGEYRIRSRYNWPIYVNHSSHPHVLQEDVDISIARREEGLPLIYPFHKSSCYLLDDCFPPQIEATEPPCVPVTLEQGVSI